jgi:hypothetical protein
MAGEEMVIFTRTFDLLDWLLPATSHFPRVHRHTFTRRLLDAAFDLRERLEEANLRRGRARQERLERADEALILVGRWLLGRCSSGTVQSLSPAAVARLLMMP